jgi:hypothetical protein
VNNICNQTGTARIEKVRKDSESMAQQLVPGDQFQNYTVQITGGRALDIPSDLKGEYANELHHRLGKKSD